MLFLQHWRLLAFCKLLKMAAGDVVVNILPPPYTAAEIDTAVTAMRVTAGASAKWMMTSTDRGDLVIVAIEE